MVSIYRRSIVDFSLGPYEEIDCRSGPRNQSTVRNATDRSQKVRFSNPPFDHKKFVRFRLDLLNSCCCLCPQNCTGMYDLGSFEHRFK